MAFLKLTLLLLLVGCSSAPVHTATPRTASKEVWAECRETCGGDDYTASYFSNSAGFYYHCTCRIPPVR